LAALEERDRIARELHDGIAQVLGYLKLKSETLTRLLAQSRMERAQSEVASMTEVIDEIYEDVRGVIMGLRTMIQPGPDVIESLKEALRRFGLDHGIETHLNIDDDKALMSLPLDVQIQLIRVIQECLSNVSKHANASSIRLMFEENEGTLRMSLEDDGLGFNPAKLEEPSWKHVGLRTSRDRIESVGGTFKIDADLGHGTRILVDLPT
jgi:signal transduction histidine kinase